MFGSGDDKKSKQAAPDADSHVSTDVQEEAAPVKKGLFSWFGRKKSQPKAEQPQVPEVEQEAEDDEAVTAPETAAVESAPTAEPPVDEPVAAEPLEPPAPTAAPLMAEPAEPIEAAEAVTEPEPIPEPVVAAPDVAATSTDTAVEPQAEPAPLDEVPAAVAVALTTDAQSVPARPSRFNLSVGREVGAPVAAPTPAVEPEPELAPEPAQVIEPEPKTEPKVEEPSADVDTQDAPLAANLAGQSKPQGNKLGWFARLKQGLAKTSSSLGDGMASLFLGKKEIDDDLLEELETRLLTADVGMEATTAIMNNLTRRVARKELADSGALYQALQVEMTELLRPVEQPMVISTEKKPHVILVIGVNGAGKTTTIGKLAQRLQNEGKKVMLAAGDTFRAAAVEQLQVWGERNKIPVIAQHTGADSASVIFDAVQAAQSRGIDVLIADTAGRLHTKDNLMEELRKVARVMGRLDDSAPHEVLLVLDAGTGQNAINQTRHFNETIPVTGLALTKLDGTAKGGVIFALAKHFQIPVRYIGVGEGIDDLRDFVADDFVKALFAEKDAQ
ncbi:MAG: signal recognition particle-docking protein FtsY [Gammaproteobacteria bacterium]|nr:signal recognition particle-docking protein FtsY [Gammaproteobacteria bacterium]